MNDPVRLPYTIKNKHKPFSETIKGYEGLIACRVCGLEKDRSDFYSSNLKIHNRTCIKCCVTYFSRYIHDSGALIDTIYNRHLSSTRRKDLRKKAAIRYTREEFYNWINKQSRFFSLYRIWKESEWEASQRPTVIRINPSKDFVLDNLKVCVVRETRNIVSNHQSKPIGQYTKEGLLLCRYQSLSQAARELKGSASHICRALNKRVKTYRGCHWKYLEKVI